MQIGIEQTNYVGHRDINHPRDLCSSVARLYLEWCEVVCAPEEKVKVAHRHDQAVIASKDSLAVVRSHLL